MSGSPTDGLPWWAKAIIYPIVKVSDLKYALRKRRKKEAKPTTGSTNKEE